MLKVSKNRNEFMKTSFLPKSNEIIVRISALIDSKYVYKVCLIENNTNLNSIFCLIKSSKIDFIFLPAFYLIMWLMTSGRGVTEAVWAVGFCLGSGLFGSCNSD